jgi:hypothetical protein
MVCVSTKDLCLDICAARSSLRQRRIVSKYSACILKNTRVDSQVSQRCAHPHRACPTLLAMFAMQFIMLFRVTESCNLPATAPTVRNLPAHRDEISVDLYPTASTRLILVMSLSDAMHLRGGSFAMLGHRSYFSSVHPAHSDASKCLPLHENMPAPILVLRQRRPPKITRSIEIND